MCGHNVHIGGRGTAGIDGISIYRHRGSTAQLLGQTIQRSNDGSHSFLALHVQVVIVPADIQHAGELHMLDDRGSSPGIQVDFDRGGIGHCLGGKLGESGCGGELLEAAIDGCSSAHHHLITHGQVAETRLIIIYVACLVAKEGSVATKCYDGAHHLAGGSGISSLSLSDGNGSLGGVARAGAGFVIVQSAVGSGERRIVDHQVGIGNVGGRFRSHHHEVDHGGRSQRELILELTPLRIEVGNSRSIAIAAHLAACDRCVAKSCRSSSIGRRTLHVGREGISAGLKLQFLGSHSLVGRRVGEHHGIGSIVCIGSLGQCAGTGRRGRLPVVGLSVCPLLEAAVREQFGLRNSDVCSNTNKKK